MKSTITFHVLILVAVLLAPTDAGALLGGSPNSPVNMTDGLISNSSGESETAALPLDVFEGNQLWTFGHVVAYNSFDATPAHVNGTEICALFSESGGSGSGRRDAEARRGGRSRDA
jgi:hypothetical protein